MFTLGKRSLFWSPFSAKRANYVGVHACLVTHQYIYKYIYNLPAAFASLWQFCTWKLNSRHSARSVKTEIKARHFYFSLTNKAFARRPSLLVFVVVFGWCCLCRSRSCCYCYCCCCLCQRHSFVTVSVCAKSFLFWPLFLGCAWWWRSSSRRRRCCSLFTVSQFAIVAAANCVCFCLT